MEPSRALRKKARAAHPSPQIQWVDDRLPELKKVKAMGLRFDLILVSAVWQHVKQGDRERVFRKLANLLKPEGQLVITLRLGPPDPARSMHAVSAEELRRLGLGQSLSLELDDGGRPDLLGREEIRWQSLVFKLADDGTGALPLLRHIIVNDNKSATYNRLRPDGQE